MSYAELLLGGLLIAFIISSMIVRVRFPKIPVWAIMAFAAFLVVVFDLVSVDEISEAVDWDVILFLIGMFSIVAVAESSGLLEATALAMISQSKSTYMALLILSVTLGLLAAIAVNDTIALLGPPIVYFAAKVLHTDPKPLYLLLAFSITIGSVATPIGNPQNMLIALDSGMDAPFIYFLKYLLLPTIMNLIILPFLIAKLYGIPDKPQRVFIVHREHIKNPRDALIAGVALAITIGALIVNDILALLGYPHIKHRGLIPFVIASATYILISNPREVINRVDWGTILFFISLFIVAEGVWSSGVLQVTLSAIMREKPDGLGDYAIITILSLLFSQALSNVPFVKLFIDYMIHIGYTGEDVSSWITLAMASTIAGNITLLGAASNIIILERLEKDYNRTISFIEFTKVGFMVTLVNIAIYTPFILLLS